MHETQSNTEEIDHWLGGNENVKERDQLHMHKLGFPFPELLANRQTEKVGGDKNEGRGEAQGEEENEMMLETLERRELR